MLSHNSQLYEKILLFKRIHFIPKMISPHMFCLPRIKYHIFSYNTITNIKVPILLQLPSYFNMKEPLSSKEIRNANIASIVN